MKTKDALKIGMALGRLIGTVDAWEESKHKRDKNGQFSSTGGAEAIVATRRSIGLTRKKLAAKKP